MNTLIRWGVFAGALLLPGATGFTDEHKDPSGKPVKEAQPDLKTENPTEAQRGAMAENMTLELGSRIIGMEVRGSDGKILGSVNDIALDSADDRIGYLSLESAGTERRIVALPWAQVTFPTAAAGSPERFITANISESDFNRAKGIDADEWPRTADVRLRGVRPDENSPPDLNPSASPEARRTEVARISRFMNSNVELTNMSAATPEKAEKPDADAREDKKADAKVQGKTIGRLQDAVIDTRTGQIAYGFIELQNPKEPKREFTTVPWTALQFNRGREPRVILRGRSDEPFLTFGFSRGEHAQQLDLLAKQAEGRRIYDAYDQGPQWDALGYVGPKNGQRDGKHAHDRIDGPKVNQQNSPKNP